jgi:hypothetical protein
VAGGWAAVAMGVAADPQAASSNAMPIRAENRIFLFIEITPLSKMLEGYSRLSIN